MAIFLETIYIPLVFICILIGYQLSVYFFYQYYHFRKDKLFLNKIMLAYGLFIFLGVSAILLRNITKFFINNPSLKEIFFKITNAFFILSIFVFLLIISSKSFNIILNVYITRFFCIISIIPLFFLFFFRILSFTLNLVLMLSIIGLLYMFVYQIKLMSLSPKNIRFKLILLFIGEFIAGSAMIIGGEFSRVFILKENESIVLLILSPLAILALIIIFFGIYKFPIFLEFRWKENLIDLFIINSLNLSLIYKFEFAKPSSENELKNYDIYDKKKQNFFSRGIFGIEDIISTIIKTNETKINKIKQGNFIFLLNEGEEPFSFIIFCLLINEEMDSHLYFLKIIKSEFFKMYKNIISNLEDITGFEKQIFSSFDSIIENLIK